MDIVKCSTNNKDRHISCLDNETYITYREIREKAIPAVAEKATANGVNWIAIDESNGDFYIYQISGYVPDLGLFNYCLDRSGNIINIV